MFCASLCFNTLSKRYNVALKSIAKQSKDDSKHNLHKNNRQKSNVQVNNAVDFFSACFSANVKDQNNSAIIIKHNYDDKLLNIFMM